MNVLVPLDESSISLHAPREAVRTTSVDLPLEGLDDEALTELAASAGLTDAETITAVGDPAHAIREAAERHVTDIVVAGTYRPVLVVSGARPPTTDVGSPALAEETRT